MYKVLLVDDELLVRMNLKLLLQNCPNLSVCGEAGNGVEAIKKVRQLQPNLIFTDIRMPEMDGVEFCQQIHKEYPNIVIIALSNYDDYPYVRGALKNGATDYLLKHKLSSESVLNLLHEIEKASTLDSCINQPQDQELSQEKIDFLKYLIYNMPASEESELYAKAEQFNLPLDLNVLVIISVIDNYDKLALNFSDKASNSIDFSVANIGMEVLSQNKNGFIFSLEEGKFCILLYFNSNILPSQVDYNVNSIIAQLADNFQKFLNISCSFGIGDLSSNLLSVNKSFIKAEKNLRFNRIYINPTLIQARNPLDPTSGFTGLDYALETQLADLLSKGNWEETLFIVKKIFHGIFNDKKNHSNIQIICTDMLSTITRVAKKNHLSLNLIFTDSITPNQIFISQLTLGQLQEWFLNAFKNTCFFIRSSLPGNSEYIKSAIKYINCNYRNPISEQDVADEIGISVSYFSTNFKSETGQGFSEYLTSVRIQTALELLNNGEKNLHKISKACGFQDYSYFSKVFKKRVGISPRSYHKL